MFSLNLLDSLTKILYFKKTIWTCHLLWKRWTCYHSVSKTRVAERIFKLRPIHAWMIYQNHWIFWIHWISDTFRENTNVNLFLYRIWVCFLIVNIRLSSVMIYRTFTSGTKEVDNYDLFYFIHTCNYRDITLKWIRLLIIVSSLGLLQRCQTLW